MVEHYSKREDLCQVSLTGIRSIVLLGLLMQAPRSLEEIREEFIKCGIMSPSNSDDILRIDLNTLKTIGCDISRADKSTNYKYQLISNPFSIKLTQSELNLLKRVYNKVKPSIEVDALVVYDSLFKKIAEQVDDVNIKNELIGMSPLKHYNAGVIEDLVKDCEKHNVLKIIYKKPTAKFATEKEIETQKVVFQNDKIYLYGYDRDKKESVSLNIKRIEKILSRSSGSDSIEHKSKIVKFRLKNLGILGLNESETILSGDAFTGYVIEGAYHNEFIATQRILSFGSNCTVLEPDDFKQSIIKSLKEIREIYRNE